MTIARPPGDASLVSPFDGAVTAGAPLVIESHEASVFVRDGTPIRVIGPGRYEVPAEFAGPSIRVFFVQTTPFPMKFGGRIPATPGGPRMVFGDATAQVTDPAAVVTQLAGTASGEALTQWIARTLLQAAGTAVTAMFEARQPIDALAQVLPQHVDIARYGLAITGVTVTAR